MSAGVDAFALLQEDLKDDDTENVIASINRLLTVALAMGPQRTREELLPFLHAFDENNEEALSAIARQLGDFVEFVGGVEHAPLLLPLLEKLASAEETVIRDAAVESFAKVIPKLSADSVAATLVPTVKRLAQGEWFTNRISACALLPMIYPRLNASLQDENRQLYITLSHDETPMVRKAAFIATGALAVTYKKEHVRSDILPALKTLSEDGADSTRVYLVDCVIAVAAVFAGDEYAEAVAPVVEAAGEDSSWRVRSKFAKQMDKLCEASGPAIGSQFLLPAYIKLLKDNEGEVRTGAMSSLLGVCKSSDPLAFKSQVLPHFVTFSTDGTNAVRVAFSEGLVDVCPVLGKDVTLTHFLPIILRLLKDDDADVRLNIISKVDVLSKVLDPDQLSQTVVPAVLEMAQDAKWRVRLSVMEKLTHIGKQLGIVMFEKTLRDVILAGLADSVYAVRTASCEQIRVMFDAFGVEWGIKKLLPSIFDIYEKAINYLHRMVPVVVIGHVATIIPVETSVEFALPILLKACKDPVSNIRLCAARTLEKMIPTLDSTLVQTRIKPLLLEMKTDADSDVQYFSSQALKHC